MKGNKRKKSRRLNRKLNFWLRKSLVDRIKELALEHGYSVGSVHPHGTSRRCSRCGAVGGRFSPSGSKALFRCPGCGYTINADANAVFNIAFLVMSRLLHADGERMPVVTRRFR